MKATKTHFLWCCFICFIVVFEYRYFVPEWGSIDIFDWLLFPHPGNLIKAFWGLSNSRPSPTPHLARSPLPLGIYSLYGENGNRSCSWNCDILAIIIDSSQRLVFFIDFLLFRSIPAKPFKRGIVLWFFTGGKKRPHTRFCANQPSSFPFIPIPFGLSKDPAILVFSISRYSFFSRLFSDTSKSRFLIVRQ